MTQGNPTVIDKRTLRAIYDRRADQVEALSRTPYYRRVSRKYEELSKNLDFQSGTTVVDIGAGTGAYLALLAESGRHRRIVATDLSPRILQKCRNTLGRTESGTKVLFVACDIEHLPFQEYAFDNVLCFQVIEHAIDDRKAISEIQRVLKADGQLRLSTDNRRNYVSRTLKLPATAVRLFLGRKPFLFDFPHRDYLVEEIEQLVCTERRLELSKVYTFRFGLPYPLYKVALLTRIVDCFERLVIGWKPFRFWGDLLVVRARKI